MINIVQWLKLWLGFGQQDGIFYIGGTDVLPPPFCSPGTLLRLPIPWAIYGLFSAAVRLGFTVALGLP